MAIEVIGTVTKLTGYASAVDGNGNTRMLSVGEPVYSNETVKTNHVGIVEIRFNNGELQIVDRNSEPAHDRHVSTVDSVALQQADIEKGKDPGEVTDAPEAGILLDEGIDAARIMHLAPRGNPENGFETRGIDFSFRETDEELLLNSTGTTGVGRAPSVVFSLQAGPSFINEESEESGIFIISRTGGILDAGVEASVRLTAPFEDNDSTSAATGSDDNSGDYRQTLFTVVENAALATQGVNFDPQTGILTFTGNADRFQFSVAVVDDDKIEGTEDIVVQLSNPQLTNGNASIVDGTANIDIIDDDSPGPPNVTFDITTVPVQISEQGEQSATFTITRSGGTLQAGNQATVQITAPFEDTDGVNAATGTDTTGQPDYNQTLITAIANAAAGNAEISFDQTSGLLTFTGAASELQFSVTAVNDDVVEGTEDIVVQLSNAKVTNGTAAIGAAIANVDITELDPNPLNGSILTSTNFDGQRTLLTFVDQSDPINSYSKSFDFGFLGGEPNLILDTGFNINPSVDHLVALEDNGSLFATAVISFTLEGVTIHDSNNATTRLGIDEMNTSDIQYGLTTIISPDDVTLLQTETLSTDGGESADDIADTGNDGFTYIFGASANDTLTGSIENDLLNGGSGADTVQGNGGNDILVFDDNDIVLDGGSGTDLLRIDNDADLRGNSAINDIEALLITDDDTSDPNTGLTVALNAQDVLNFSDTDNTLFIRGNDGDQADLGNEFVTDGSSNTDGFVTYTATVNNILVSVLIEDSITVV